MPVLGGFSFMLVQNALQPALIDPKDEPPKAACLSIEDGHAAVNALIQPPAFHWLLPLFRLATVCPGQGARGVTQDRHTVDDSRRLAPMRTGLAAQSIRATLGQEPVGNLLVLPQQLLKVGQKVGIILSFGLGDEVQAPVEPGHQLPLFDTQIVQPG